jgi:serine/threonine protein kinase
VQYGRDSVVVEWRVVDQARWKQVERAMQRLAFLLSAMGKATFHTLPCLGLVASQAAGHIGLVYQITSRSPNSTCTWHHTSLFTILGQSHTISLSRRVALAIEMAETLFQVHTAGWLHKGLRSENIIFLSTSTEIGSSIVFSQGYLVGFEYSRPDSSAAVCLTEPPRDPLSTDLYRHPAARGLSRETYSKRFDLYSLGCLLLELALWKQVGEIALMSHQPVLALDVDSGIHPTRGGHSPSFLDFESFTVLQDLVRYHAGDSFCNAIALCFTESQDDTGATTKAHGKILETLRSCRQGH